MNYRQINRTIEVLTNRGYQKDYINWWLNRDANIVEEYLDIPLSELEGS